MIAAARTSGSVDPDFPSVLLGPIPDKLWLTSGEAAKMLGVGRDRFRSMVNRGVIKFYRDPETPKGLRMFSVEVLRATARDLGSMSEAS